MRLLLISLDGLWEEDIHALERLPYIGALIRMGTLCKNVQTIYPALTYPVHTTILTGCYPNQHGIAHNQPFSPDTSIKNRKWYWEASQIKRPTMHQLIHEKGGTTASILWPVTGKNPYIRWNFPEVLALPHENQTLKMLQYGSAPWILAMELLYGKQRKGIHQPDLDDYAALLAEKLILSKRPPDFLTLHLVDCDEMRHLYGVRSKEASQAIARLDERVGRLMTALDRKQLGKDTIVALVSDHGLADISKTVSLEQALAEAGFIGMCKAQSTGMGAYLHFNRATTEQINNVKSFLLQKKEELGISHIYDADDLISMGAGRGIYLAVEAMPGVVFVDELEHKKREKATHGFGPGHSASRCLFAIAGPGIRKGAVISSANMVDIAPTLMSAIGHTMSSAQGRIVVECFENG